jgi:HSP20 family protein
MMERYRPRRRALATWNPLREMEEMERMIDEAFGRPMMWRRLPEEEYIWSPSIEMYEKENTYIVRMELPGVRPEDVEISMSGDTLMVKGERKPPEDIKDEEYQLCEVCYGSFTRTIALPESVNADKIEANFENGILDIHLPKAEEIKPRQIKVQSKQLQSSMSQSRLVQKSESSQESMPGSRQSKSEKEPESKSKAR